MKFLLIVILFVNVKLAVALPVLNRNVAPGETKITLFPDHQNPDLFHVLPGAFKMTADADFHVYERAKKKYADLWFPVERWFKEDDLRKVQELILKMNSRAQFRALDIDYSHLQVVLGLDDLIGYSECGTQKVEFGFYCFITFNSLGVKIIGDYLKKKKNLPFSAEIQIHGVVERAGNKFEALVMSQGLPIIVDPERKLHF